ncbi:MAG: YdcF family protein [Nitrospinota bacterium]|nr:YdcF family protein [Nitrospinota bacterium]
METGNYLAARKGSLYAKIRGGLALFGIFSLLFLVSGLTGSYRSVSDWLSTAEYSGKCDFIVLLPAGPIPNTATMARAYKTADEYAKNPSARVIISHRMDDKYIGSTLWTIKRELMMRGVPEEAIIFEKKARSTREHAKYIKEQKIGDFSRDSYLLVSSSLHIKRSVLAFRAAGFSHIYASAATYSGVQESLGDGQYLRYGVWERLREQIDVTRELVAILFYKINGWA